MRRRSNKADISEPFKKEPVRKDGLLVFQGRMKDDGKFI